jgi:N-acetylmuramoyl-L-alanine amidase/Bacterial SH3 domain
MRHAHTIASKLALASAFSALLSCVAGCRNDVAPPEDGHTAVFVAEGDELLDQLDVTDGYATSPLLAVREGSTRIGLRYDAVGPVDAHVRVSEDGGSTFGEWQRAALTFTEEGAHNARVEIGVPRATHAQVRFMAAVESGLSFLAVDTFIPAEEAEAQLSTISQGLAADGIALPRSAWGARSRSCNTASTPARITVHHTETPTNDSMSVPARLRQIQNYHIDVRGWCDIGYHFLVGRDGNVYQGRRENTLGAHVANANSGNVGVAFIGSFMNAPPTIEMENAAARIIGAVSRGYGITLNRTNVKGHRERGSTDCPGDELYARLGALVTAANGDASDAAPAPDRCEAVRVVGAGTLNVRPDPSTSVTPRGTLDEGDVVDVLSIVEDGQNVQGVRRWFEIESGSLRGFVSGAYAQCEDL